MEYMSSTYPTIDSSTTSAEWIHQQNQQIQQGYQPNPYQNQQIIQMIPVTPEVGLEEAMWGMSLGQTTEGMDAQYYPDQYPQRPDEPDCSYYMRTGLCGFGANCKFNHPPSRRVFANRSTGGEFPERHGQQECQYYLKTGNCKFGPSCKFHHPREKAGATGRAQLNALNLPLRPGEKDCAYYMRTGACKYGATCKFHHPSPVLSIQGSTPVFAGSSTNAAQIPHQMYPGLSGWSLQRSPYLPSPGPSDFTPILIPSSQVSMPPWNPYSVPFTVTDEGQEALTQRNYIYGGAVIPSQESMAIGVYPPFVPVSGNMGLPTAPSLSTISTAAQVEAYPERPGQPECQYYMRTGECRYGPQCRYHHPKERNGTSGSANLYGSVGLLTR